MHACMHPDVCRSVHLRSMSWHVDPASTFMLSGKAAFIRFPPLTCAFMQLAYLQSYGNMGSVRHDCISGCKCTSRVIESLDDEHKTSTTVVRPLLVRSALFEACIIGLWRVCFHGWRCRCWGFDTWLCALIACLHLSIHGTLILLDRTSGPATSPKNYYLAPAPTHSQMQTLAWAPYVVQVGQHANCTFTLSINARKPGTPGGTKFKLMGVMVRAATPTHGSRSLWMHQGLPAWLRQMS